MIPVAKPSLGSQETVAIQRVIESGWVTQGPEVASFEDEFAFLVGAPHACAVSSCTAALHIALLALDIGPGDEVITVSHSYIATSNAICHTGATPVFVDVEKDTCNMNPASLENAVSSATKAILCVHQMGMPCDLDRILSVANNYKLPVVEDAACAIGSQIHWNGQWENIGKPHGDIACFSFHPRKVMTTGDGGMLTTANAEIDARLRLLRQHGMNVSDQVRHSAKSVVFEEYLMVGYNYRMTDIQAAVGREQIKRLTSIVERRRAIAMHYSNELRKISGIKPMREPDGVRNNWQSYPIWLEEGIEQSVFMQELLDLGVASRRGIICAHREPAYTSNKNWRLSDPSCALKESEYAQDQTVIIPLYPDMSDAEVETVIRSIRLVMKRINNGVS